MIIHVVVVRQSSGGEDSYWVAEAWDEYTVDENGWGFEEALQRCRSTHGADNVRVLKVQLPADALERPFRVPVVEGLVEG
jgi:hypothetical protein